MEKSDRRPPRAQVNSARERLILAAMKEFAARGFEGARVAAIAAAADINKQLVYHYFGSKEGLHQEVLSEAYKRFRGDDEALRESIAGLDPRSALIAFIGHLFKLTEESTTFQRLLQDENLRGAPTLRKIEGIAQSYASMLQTLADILRLGEEKGIFRAVDHREFYVSLVGVFGIRETNAQTLAISVGLPLTTPEGARASRDAAIDFVLAAVEMPDTRTGSSPRPTAEGSSTNRRSSR